MIPSGPLSADALKIDAPQTAERIERGIREIVVRQLRRKGVVVGLSGGIDSSVVAYLSARALGRDRVIGVCMPEADSSPDSLRLGRDVATALGIRVFVEDIAGILDAAGCYRRRDEAIRTVVPEYTAGWKSKIVLPDLVGGARYALYSVVVRSPLGEERRVRLRLDAYLGIVAATNFKQRTRKMLEYYYADRFNFAVAGTPNRLEHDQGFFVKNGDGSADVKPIAHLYKSQVYQLAAWLGVPQEIQDRPSTTDTYSLEQSQEEFYFALSLPATDLCLLAKNRQVPPANVADAVGLTTEQVERVYRMIDARRTAARYLRAAPMLVEPLA
jgi:NAD+ synthase